VRVIVDRELCGRNAICMGIAPDVFSIGDDDQLHVLVTEVTPDQKEDVLDAVATCPNRALRTVD
jgi:ferredoxin